MWHFRIWFSRHGVVGWMVGLDDLRDLFQLILWFYTSPCDAEVGDCGAGPCPDQASLEQVLLVQSNWGKKKHMWKIFFFFFWKLPLSKLRSCCCALPVFPALLLFALLCAGMRQRELPVCGGGSKHPSPFGLFISDSSFSQGLCQVCAGFLEPPDEGFPCPFLIFCEDEGLCERIHVKAMLSGVVFTYI